MRNLKITQQITNRNGKSIEAYLREVAKEEMITPEEEVQLAKRVKQGDKFAADKLVRANLRFVISVAKQYQNHGLELEDLINEGNIGLIEAANRFDESRGFKFISYAVWWIRQAILKAISDKSRKIRVPSNRTLEARRLAEAKATIEQANEREASIEEIAAVMEKSVKEVRELMKINSKELSIDSQLNTDSDSSSMKDVLEDPNMDAPTDGLIYESLNSEIQTVLRKMDAKEAKIISMYYGLDGQFPSTINDISEELGISTSNVRQKKDKALKLLRKSGSLDRLKTYLG
ncbi:MAG: RNA polymerase sigma factor RpoD/SigA [Saprospiraceae bacterium]|nr:RNA polymerase sigma factor RpoD/SigA [Saprospiraceae bacterium]